MGLTHADTSAENLHALLVLRESMHKIELGLLQFLDAHCFLLIVSIIKT